MSNKLDTVGMIIAITGTILSVSTGLYFMNLNKKSAHRKYISEDTDSRN
jgi:hypothetical protein